MNHVLLSVSRFRSFSVKVEFTTRVLKLIELKTNKIKKKKQVRKTKLGVTESLSRNVQGLEAGICFRVLA